MQFTKKQFLEIKEKAILQYKGTASVRCPYRDNDVAFNRKGLEHLEFKSWGKARLLQDQYPRFKLLKYARIIIKKSHTLQEYKEIKKLEEIKVNSRWEKRMKVVKYYGFVAIINEIRLKVIVKNIEGGSNYFWSIIPFWKQDNKIKYKKIFHTGDLEDD